MASRDYARVNAILEQLCNDYAYAVHQPHARNGGLIGLAAAAIALGQVGYFSSLLSPFLSPSLCDPPGVVALGRRPLIPN